MKHNDHSSPREKVSHLFTVGLFIGTLYLLFELISPFLGAFVGAITLGISFYPFHLWIKKRLSFAAPAFQAAISDLAVIFFIVVPLFLMTWAAVEQSETWTPSIQNLKTNLEQWRAGEITSWLNNKFSIKPAQVQEQIVKSANRILSGMGSFGTKAAGIFVSSIGNIGMMLFVLFFVFRDGPKIYSHFESYLPLREEQKKECKERGAHMVTSVIRGWFLGAIIQGLIASLGFLLVGLNGWIFFGFLTCIAGLLPVVGTALIWVPLAMKLFFDGSAGKGIFLLTWGIVAVGLIDNVIRPYLVRKGSDVPFLYLFISLLGGLQVWGLKGIILGPVLVAVAPVIFDIYKKRYMAPENDDQERLAN